MKKLKFIIESKQDAFGVSPEKFKKDISEGGKDYDYMHEVAQNHLTGDTSHIKRNEKNAISRWTQNSPTGYKEINSHLRNGNGDKETREITGHLENAVRGHSIPHDTWGYRGVHSVHAKNLDKLKSGDVFHNKGFASTTLDPNKATHFARGEHMLAVHIPKGTNALYVSHPNLNSWTSEREMVLAPSTHYKYSHSENIEAPEYHYSGSPTGKTKKIKLHHVEAIPQSQDNSIQIDK
jgi:hypothetical protein